MAPPPGQTNRDTSAADHTTCFYCHQQLILVSHKVIVSRDAHGCSIRICEPCEKEARRRRPLYQFGWLPWRPAVLRCIHAVDSRHLQERRSWVVSFSILRPFGPRRAAAMRRVFAVAAAADGDAVVSTTQVKVEKKDEGIEAMRKLMGGAADEDKEEGN